ncbi:Hypothetical predicted protein [Pelobates cultripes]|uniref:exodeoxyribonuclease III n=1 Tax=Pelobates cultripes TaxID=61616 RepID=A0AAD1QZQ1_PELCU|nr:Hypothetical predicted protein [Pelobates cultripes]
MTYSAAPFHIITQNCRGLNAPEKRAHLLQDLKRRQVSIALLQETHLRDVDNHRLRNKHYHTTFHSNHPTARKAGVSILLNTNLQFTHSETVVDPNGRFLFVKGMISQKTYTLASVYAPNKSQAKFLCRTLLKLAAFTEGILVLGGDFNITLEPLSDSSTGHSSIAQAAIRRIRKTLQDLRLVDTWRTLHPDDRDYTYYSPLHSRYSRIDYIFIQQEGLTFLKKAAIRPTPWADHSESSIHLDSPLFRPTQKTWRINESLLLDTPIRTQIAEHLNQYFAENTTEDMSNITLWEAHKSVLRGHLIRIASRKKRENQQAMADLTAQIANLETLHKRSQMETHYRELLTARRQLTELIDRKHHRAIQRSKAFYYLHANKGGKMLARLIRGQQARAQVQAIRTSNGHLTHPPTSPPCLRAPADEPNARGITLGPLSGRITLVTNEIYMARGHAKQEPEVGGATLGGNNTLHPPQQH